MYPVEWNVSFRHVDPLFGDPDPFGLMESPCERMRSSIAYTAPNGASASSAKALSDSLAS
jgi:hypothetical protein